MAILAFQKPDKVVMLEANERFGKFEFRPLEPGGLCHQHHPYCWCRA